MQDKGNFGILLEKYEAEFLMIWKLFFNCLELAGRLPTVCLLMLFLTMPLQWILRSMDF
jgi:hypothetical protein